MLYKNIVSALTKAGIAVYDPGLKIGICTAPYVVVQESGSYRFAESWRLGYTLIEVHCYVPLNQYAALAELVNFVKSALRPLYPDLRPTGTVQPYGINDKFKAHQAAVEYQILKVNH